MNQPVSQPALSHATVQVRGQSAELAYAPSRIMESVIREVFRDEAYPYLPMISAAGTILDVGANIGCASLLFRLLYPEATLLAVEPAREAFALLERNVGRFQNVRLYPFALADRDGEASLFEGNESWATNSIACSPHNSNASQTVPVRRASTFLASQGIDCLSLLKIDTEGCEVPILRDLLELLPRVEAVMLEYHSESDRRTIDSLLSPTHQLFAARARFPHRGTLTYVREDVIVDRTSYSRLEVAPSPFL
jgi:FkbM family methyltransferase